jgi:hypothetical protein
VSASWLAGEVRAGRIRWVLSSGRGAAGGPTLPGDTRTGSRSALSAVAKVCRAVALPASSAEGASRSVFGSGAAASTLYDCQGRAKQLSGT